MAPHRPGWNPTGCHCSPQPEAFTLGLLPSGPGVGDFGSGVIFPDGISLVTAKTVTQLDLDLNLSGTIEPDEEQLDVAAVLELNCVAPTG